jgi:GNAT superfamily N-acetyltransferase
MPVPVLLQKDNLLLIVKHEADNGAIELLKNTIYGTEGIRYQQTGQARKILDLYDPLFFHLYIDNQLQGMYCLDHRVIDNETHLDAFYGRYLSVAQAHQGKGYGQLLKTEAVNYVKSMGVEPFLFYSYVEEKNTRSLAISRQLDFTSIATLRTFVFRSLFPGIDKRFEQLQEPSAFLPLLKNYYQHHSLAVFKKVFDQDNYFVLKEGANIVAGVHGQPTTWRFARMPGVGGWVMMNIFAKIPLFKKLFHANYTFVALEGIYLLKGYEHLLPMLIESVLAHFNLYTAIFQIDSKDKLVDTLQKSRNTLSGFQNNITTHVLIKSVGLSNEELSSLVTGRVYVSSFDFT